MMTEPWRYHKDMQIFANEDPYVEALKEAAMPPAEIDAAMEAINDALVLAALLVENVDDKDTLAKGEAAFEKISKTLRHRWEDMPPDLRPMTSFDPSKPAMVFDELNRELFLWKPKWHDSFMEHAEVHDEERAIVGWDGLLLAGWREVGEGE